MSEDDLILAGTTGLLALTLAGLSYRSRKPFRTLLIHALIWVCYAGPLLYGLKCHNAGGVGLVWFIYLLAAHALHWLIVVILLIRSFMQTTGDHKAS